MNIEVMVGPPQNEKSFLQKGDSFVIRAVDDKVVVNLRRGVLSLRLLSQGREISGWRFVNFLAADTACRMVGAFLGRDFATVNAAEPQVTLTLE